MISQVRIVDPNYQARAGVETVDFQPGVNVIVGGNGSGKSSLLQAIKREYDMGDQRTARLTRDSSVDVLFYIGEEATNQAAAASGNSLAQVRQSHGQRLLSYLAGLNHLVGEATVIMDEPEMALDFWAVYQLCASMIDRERVQFIVSSHHPLFLTFRDANIINMDRDRPNYTRDVLKQLSTRLQAGRKA